MSDDNITFKLVIMCTILSLGSIIVGPCLIGILYQPQANANNYWGTGTCLVTATTTTSGYKTTSYVVEFTVSIVESSVHQAVGKSATFVGCQYCTESAALSTVNQYEVGTNQSCVVSQCGFGEPYPSCCTYIDSVRFTPYTNDQALLIGGIFLIAFGGLIAIGTVAALFININCSRDRHNCC